MECFVLHKIFIYLLVANKTTVTFKIKIHLYSTLFSPELSVINSSTSEQDPPVFTKQPVVLFPSI